MDNIRQISNNTFHRRAFKKSHFDSYEFNITNTSIETNIKNILDNNILPFLYDYNMFNDPYSLRFCLIDSIENNKDGKDIITSSFKFIIIPSVINGRTVTIDNTNMYKYKNRIVVYTINLNEISSDLHLNTIDKVLESKPDGIHIILNYSKSINGDRYSTILSHIKEQTNMSDSFISILESEEAISNNYGYDVILHRDKLTDTPYGNKATFYIYNCDNYSEVSSASSICSGNLYTYESSVGLNKVNVKYNMLSDDYDINTQSLNTIISNLEKERNLIEGLFYE